MISSNDYNKVIELYEIDIPTVFENEQMLQKHLQLLLEALLKKASND